MYRLLSLLISSITSPRPNKQISAVSSTGVRVQGTHQSVAVGWDMQIIHTLATSKSLRAKWSVHLNLNMNSWWIIIAKLAESTCGSTPISLRWWREQNNEFLFMCDSELSHAIRDYIASEYYIQRSILQLRPPHLKRQTGWGLILWDNSHIATVQLRFQ